MGRKKSRAGKKRKGRGRPEGGRFVRPAVRLVGAGASRARDLLKSLLSSRRGRLRVLSDSTGALPVQPGAPKPGLLDAFQSSIDDLETRATAFELPVDFSHFRRRLEALLSVLLDVEDDRLVGEAAGRIREGLELDLPRAEAIFLVPEVLFGNIDLARPPLARVRAACESGDHDGARVALLEHLAEKPLPEGLVRWLRRRSSRVLDEAGLVGRGFLSLGSKGWTFLDHPVRWEELHESGAHSHAEAAVLARAYVETGDESYAKEAARHILEWAARVTPPDAETRPETRRLRDEEASGEDAGLSPAWDSGCAAARLLNWSTVFVTLRGSSAFSPEVARTFLVLVQESAEMVRVGARREPAPRAEVQALAGAALLVAGTLFDDFRDASSWREEGGRLLVEAARAGLLPDGGWNSPALADHERVLECFVTAALAAPGERDFSRQASRMLEFASGVVFPDGRLPGQPYSDGAIANDRLSYLARARALLGLEEAAPPGGGLRAFEESGVFVMRAGGRERPDSLVFGTAGALGIHVAAGGPEALSVPGPTAHAGLRRAQTSASSVEPSSRGEGGPKSASARAGPPCDYVRAAFGLAGGAVETREVLHVDRRFWVISVRVRSETAADRTFEMDIFPPECLASPDGRRLVVGAEESAALVELAGPSDSGFRLNETPAGRTVQATARGADVHFVTLVYPLHGENAHAITVEPVVQAAQGGAARGLILKRPGAEYAVAFPHGGGGELSRLLPGVSGLHAAALKWSGTRGEGQWRTLFSLGRTS